MKSTSEILDEFIAANFPSPINFEKPIGYNQKIQWLKMYDRTPEITFLCDKLIARDYVARECDSKLLLDVYQVSRSVDGIDYNSLPSQYMLKTNHDSGTVFHVNDWKSLVRSKKRIRKNLKRIYGAEDGEWGYAHVFPYVYAEQFMDGPIIDYKFHCCRGEVKWVQIISDRQSGQPTEVNVRPDFSVLGLHFDHKMRFTTIAPPQPKAWNEMVEIAQTLSQKFQYVRVDLYDYGGRPIFGEMTFWPLAGLYKTEDESTFGDMLDIDLSKKLPTSYYKIEYGYTKRGLRAYLSDRLSEKYIQLLKRLNI